MSISETSLVPSERSIDRQVGRAAGIAQRYVHLTHGSLLPPFDGRSGLSVNRRPQSPVKRWDGTMSISEISLVSCERSIYRQVGRAAGTAQRYSIHTGLDLYNWHERQHAHLLHSLQLLLHQRLSLSNK